MPCTSHHSLHCWKLPSRIRTPLSTCLDATVDIVEIDEGTEVKARTDGRRTRIGGTEVPGPGVSPTRNTCGAIPKLDNGTYLIS